MASWKMSALSICGSANSIALAYKASSMVMVIFIKIFLIDMMLVCSKSYDGKLRFSSEPSL